MKSKPKSVPDEKSYVEIPFIEQLKGLGWQHLEGDLDVPYLTEREGFRDVLLTNRLKTTLKAINLDERGKVVAVTDRIQLEGQLKGSAALTGETVYHAKDKHALARYLKEDSSNIVFTMVQKYQETAPESDDYEIP